MGIPLSAVGTGNILQCDQAQDGVLECGHQFVGRPFSRQLCVRNMGRRPQTLHWSCERFEEVRQQFTKALRAAGEGCGQVGPGQCSSKALGLQGRMWAGGSGAVQQQGSGAAGEGCRQVAQEQCSSQGLVQSCCPIRVDTRLPVCLLLAMMCGCVKLELGPNAV